jgi:YegS/Rv2252/BmrU family lipid kinase
VHAYNAVIQADTKAEQLNQSDNAGYAALAPLAGRPLLEWVVDALDKSPRIKHMTVIGPPALRGLLCMRRVDRLISPEQLGLAGWLDAVSLFGASELKNDPVMRNPVLAVSCMTPLIDKRIIRAYVTQFERNDAPIGLAAVRTPMFRRFAPGQLDSRLRLHGVVAAPIALVDTYEFLHDALKRIDAALRTGIDSGRFDFRHVDASRWYDPGKDSHVRVLVGRDPRAAFVYARPEDESIARPRLRSIKRNHFRQAALLINPHSGAASGMTRVVGKLFGVKQRAAIRARTPADCTAAILSDLGALGIHPEVFQTASHSETTAAARDLVSRGYDLVIAAGGDGTINAVVNGLAYSRTALGVIPLGTVNLFAIELEIPAEIRSACQLIAEGQIRQIDLGMVNERYFTSIAGVGFDALVMKEAESGLKKALGVLAYPLIMARMLARYRFEPIRISIDSESRVRKGYLFAAGNGKYYSGDMVFAPEASMQDGKLDFVLYKSKGAGAILKIVRGLRTGELANYSEVEYVKAAEARVHRGTSHGVQVDGDYAGSTPVTIHAAPAALRVVC